MGLVLSRYKNMVEEDTSMIYNQQAKNPKLEINNEVAKEGRVKGKMEG